MRPRARRWVACLIAASLVLAFAPGAAQAHAVLLRSTPGPQAALTTSPPSVLLHFSEAVENALGALRVYDNAGRDVGGGQPTRTNANRDLELPLRPLAEGTYVVDWRVVSADGHPAYGTFTFYVGTPSPGTALPDAGNRLSQAASTVATWGYGVVRFLWFAAFLLLLGALAVDRWVWRPAVDDVGAAGTPAVATFERRFRALVLVAAITLAAGTLLQLPAEAATVSGRTLTGSLAPHVLGQILRTGFGRLWLVTAAAATVALVATLVRRRAAIALGLTVAALAAAASGHARTERLPVLAVSMVALHLLAVALWVGGLAALLAAGLPAWRALPDTRRGEQLRPALLQAVVTRFTRLAIVGVAVVLLTGTITALPQLGPLGNLWHVTWGRLLLAKIVLLVVALALAARHLLVTPARLTQPTQARAEVTTFERTSLTEAGALAAAVIIAAALVAVPPGRTVIIGSTGTLQRAQHAGSYQVELTIDPLALGPNQLHLTFVNEAGIAASEIGAATGALTPPTGPASPLDLQPFSGGQWVSQVTLPSAGPYRLTVSGQGTQTVRTTFRFRLAGTKP
ncbi:MAG TPA: copper resistance protein CopC [Acidimicrobiales bacterium]|nr:copper resistance protein CopC [Acidimicrobiales bacterium]